MNALFARLLGPIAARIPGHDARMLIRFSLAEQASMLDLRAAARLSPSPSRRALYLRHALDESRHARMFSQRAAELRRARGEAPPGPPDADIEHLYEVLGEAGFLAFVHRGERRGRQQFEVHRAAFKRRGDEKTAALFDAIITDEIRHETYTRELLRELAGEEREARAALRRSAAWEAYRIWRRAGRSIAALVYTALMMALYVTLLPFALLVRAARPERTGWIPAAHLARPPGDASAPVTAAATASVTAAATASFTATASVSAPVPASAPVTVSATASAAASPSASPHP